MGFRNAAPSSQKHFFPVPRAQHEVEQGLQRQAND